MLFKTPIYYFHLSYHYLTLPYSTSHYLTLPSSTSHYLTLPYSPFYTETWWQLGRKMLQSEISLSLTHRALAVNCSRLKLLQCTNVSIARTALTCFCVCMYVQLLVSHVLYLHVLVCVNKYKYCTYFHVHVYVCMYVCMCMWLSVCIVRTYMRV